MYGWKSGIECAYSLPDKVAGDIPKTLTVTLRIFEVGKVGSYTSIGLQLQVSRGEKVSIQVDKIRGHLGGLLDDQACLFVHIDRLVQRLTMKARLAIYEGLDLCHEIIAWKSESQMNNNPEFLILDRWGRCWRIRFPRFRM